MFSKVALDPGRPSTYVEREDLTCDTCRVGCRGRGPLPTEPLALRGGGPRDARLDVVGRTFADFLPLSRNTDESFSSARTHRCVVLAYGTLPIRANATARGDVRDLGGHRASRTSCCFADTVGCGSEVGRRRACHASLRAGHAVGRRRAVAGAAWRRPLGERPRPAGTAAGFQRSPSLWLRGDV